MLHLEAGAAVIVHGAVNHAGAVLSALPIAAPQRNVLLAAAVHAATVGVLSGLAGGLGQSASKA